MMDFDPPPAANAAASSTAEPPEVALVRTQLAQLLDDSAAALHRACFDVAKDGMDHCEELVRDDDPLPTEPPLSLVLGVCGSQVNASILSSLWAESGDFCCTPRAHSTTRSAS